MAGHRNTVERTEWQGKQRESQLRVRDLDQVVFPYGKRASTGEFRWDSTLHETFNFNGACYDVTAAKEIIRNRPRMIKTFRVEEVAPLLPDMPDETVRRTLSFGVSIDWDRVEAGTGIDLSIPVIVVTNGFNRLPIDGFHRVARARLLWVRELSCVILTRQETDRIRLPFP